MSLIFTGDVASTSMQEIESQVASIHFKQLDEAMNVDGLRLELVTLCVVVLKNGFILTGTSACNDKTKFNLEVGQQVAKTNALNQMWQLIGYKRREEAYQFH